MSRQPLDPAVVKAQARQQLEAGSPGPAQQLLSTLCEDCPEDVEAWSLLAMASAQQQDIATVAACCRRIIALQPANPQAYYNLGVALQQDARHVAAADAYRRTVELAPGNVSAWANLGLALKDIGKQDDAVAACQQALQLQPLQSVALNTLGVIARDRQQFVMALDCFDRAVAAQPDYIQANWNRAQVLLELGDYARGWEAFEWRWQEEPRMVRESPFPPWQGPAAGPVSLLVYPEQGIGDQIMYGSCLPDLQRINSKLVVGCEPRLVPLFTRAFPGIHVIGGPDYEAWLDGVREIDAQVSVGSLPRYFRRAAGTFPQTVGYLQADAEAAQAWQARMADGNGRLKVGISWRGGGDVRTRASRSTPLADWLPLLQLPGLYLVNLQYGDHREEIRTVEQQAGITLHDWPEGDPLDDLDAFAARISVLDLVISIDNTTVHVAGALGIPTWTLVPRPWDLRWFGSERKTPWYPQMTLYRQPTPGDWQTVLQTVAQDLATLARG